MGTLSMQLSSEDLTEELARDLAACLRDIGDALIQAGADGGFVVTVVNGDRAVKVLSAMETDGDTVRVLEAGIRAVHYDPSAIPAMDVN